MVNKIINEKLPSISLPTIESQTALELLQHNLKRKHLISIKNGFKNANEENEFIEYPYLTLLQQNPVSCKMKRYSLRPFEIGLGITEISGEAGCGKTQICLGLCVSCVLSTTMWCDHAVNKVFHTSAKNGTDKPHSHIRLGDDLDTLCNYKISSVQNPYEKYEEKKSNATLELDDKMTRNSMHFNIPKKIDYRHFSAIYICLGDEGIQKSHLSSRLDQMIRARMRNHQRSKISSDVSSLLPLQQTLQQNHISSILSRILIRHLRNLDEFRNFIFFELPSLLSYQQNEQQSQENDNNRNFLPTNFSNKPIDHINRGKNKVGLIVFDSISGIFRNWDDIDSNGNKYSNRSSEFFSTSSQLKRISETFRVPIVFANQVTAKINSNLVGIVHVPSSRGVASFIPALGLSWSHCVNTRYLVTRQEVNYDDVNFGPFTKEEKGNIPKSLTFQRHISLLLSSNLFMETTVSASNGVPFKINATGAILNI